MTIEVAEIAARLAAAAGLSWPGAINRLSGGKNNRVFRVGDNLVLKLYHWDARDTRDRLRAEWQFLTYAWDRGVRNIPQPLACDATLHAGLYTLLPGSTPASVTARNVGTALNFLLAVNAAPRDLDTFDPGSEACFSLGEHIATIQRRVARLSAVDPSIPGADAAKALIAARLRPVWEDVRATLLSDAKTLGISIDTVLDSTSPCISPSDFGFHNALTDRERTCFIDFEYAGRDDPAKLVCDFFCQPQVPVPLAYMADFTRDLISGLGLDASHETRCRLLLNAYRVKWACIILNDFLPLGSARRAYADLAGSSERSTAQLARAAAKLAEIEETPHGVP